MHTYWIPKDNRCYAKSISQYAQMETLEMVSAGLDESYRKKLQNSCFGYMFDSKCLKFRGVHFSSLIFQEIVYRIIKCDKKNEFWFKFNDLYTRFSIVEFAIVSGLRCGEEPKGKKYDAIISDKSFSLRHFGGGRPKIKQIIDLFKKDTTTKQDKYKLALLIVCGVLCGYNKEAFVSLKALSLINDEEVFESFPWGKESYNRLSESIRNTWNTGLMMKFRNTDHFALNGWPLILQIWAYEVIPSLGETFCRVVQAAPSFPRLLRWYSESKFQRPKVSSFFGENKVSLYATLNRHLKELPKNHVMEMEDEVDDKLDGIATKVLEIQEPPLDVDVHVEEGIVEHERRDDESELPTHLESEGTVEHERRDDESDTNNELPTHLESEAIVEHDSRDDESDTHCSLLPSLLSILSQFLKKWLTRSENGGLSQRKFVTQGKRGRKESGKKEVFELSDAHVLLTKLPKRLPDDPFPYMLDIWDGEGEEGGDVLEGGFVYGTFLAPCHTTTKGQFLLNGTYFQHNEVFVDAETSESPIEVSLASVQHLPKRTLYFGSSVSSIYEGMNDEEEIESCFNHGNICFRGFDFRTRQCVPLSNRFFLRKSLSRAHQVKRPKKNGSELSSNKDNRPQRQSDRELIVYTRRTTQSRKSKWW